MREAFILVTLTNSTKLIKHAFGENSVHLMIFPGRRLTLVFIAEVFLKLGYCIVNMLLSGVYK